MAETSIEWTDCTWNPVTGCTRASAGCDNCYAVTMTKRLAAMGQVKYLNLVNEGKQHFNGTVKCHEDALRIPLTWKKPRKIFVNSMSDLFHKEVSFDFIDQVLAMVAQCPQHTFQVLTKRPERMAEYFEGLVSGSAANRVVTGPSYRKFHSAVLGYRTGRPLHNLWLGTSVEDQKTADERIPHLLRIPAAVRFLSCEPLLGPVDLLRVDAVGFGGNAGHKIDCIRKGYWDDSLGFVNHSAMHDEFGSLDWVICGGESGPNARPMHPDWARSLRDQCESAKVPFLFKQWGEWTPAALLEEGNNESVDEGDEVFRRTAKNNVGFVAQCGDLNYAVFLEEIGLFYPADPDASCMLRVGKKKAGRILDKRTWDQFPEVNHG